MCSKSYCPSFLWIPAVPVAPDFVGGNWDGGNDGVWRSREILTITHVSGLLILPLISK